MTTRAQNKIDRIMGNAYEQAFKVLETEVKKFLSANPMFKTYIHAVGWGPGFYLTDGKCFQYSHEMPTVSGRKLFEFCDFFYDTYGAANERVEL